MTLTRRTPLARGKAPKRTAPPKRKTALAGASAKTIAARPSKATVREAVFARDGGCRMARHPSPCSGRLTPHHLRKSSDCGRYVEANLIALCVFHNCTWVEGHPIEAEAMGLAERGLQTTEETWRKLFFAGLAASPEVGSGPVAS